jgi:hypothetical protein
MSGMNEQKTINVNGVIYDAVTFAHGSRNCMGCELPPAGLQ